MHDVSIPNRARLRETAKKISSFVAGVFFLVVSSATYAQPAMTIEQKVGQLFVWTYPGQALTKRGRQWLERYQPGALLVFSRNIKNPTQIARFNSDLRTFARRHMKAPLFLMIDQEGGLVTRVKLPVPLPSALALGRVSNPTFVENFAKASGQTLYDLGFNVNLAPVMDLSDPQMKTFIGSRSFGDDPHRVSSLSLAYSKGLEEAGLIPTAKHFPGHGGLVQDSHHVVPRKLATYSELMKKDWLPFRAFAHQQYPKMLMVAHLAVPKIDPSGKPATFSKILIQKYLRHELGYDGVIVTDDLEMGGADISKDIGERAVRAFLAGNDMLMLAGSPRHQREAFRALVAAVRAGRISMQRLDTSIARILKVKHELKNADFHFNPRKTRTSMRHLQELSREVLRRNFLLSVPHKTAVTIPPLNLISHVLVVSADKRVYDSFKFHFPGRTDFFRLTPRTLDSTSSTIKNDRPSLIVYYASGEQTAGWLKHMDAQTRRRTIVINTNPAALIQNQNSFAMVLNVASSSPESGGWLADYLMAPTIRAPASEALVFRRVFHGL